MIAGYTVTSQKKGDASYNTAMFADNEYHEANMLYGRLWRYPEYEWVILECNNNEGKSTTLKGDCDEDVSSGSQESLD